MLRFPPPKFPPQCNHDDTQSEYRDCKNGVTTWYCLNCHTEYDKYLDGLGG